MDIYLDKENLANLMKLYDENKKYIQVIKNNFDTIWFNFFEEDLDDKVGSFLGAFTSGNTTRKTPKINYLKPKDSIFPFRGKIKKMPKNQFSKDQLTSIYLINANKNVINHYKNKSGILIGGSGEEKEILDKIFLQNEDYKFDRKLMIAGKYFTEWSKNPEFNKNNVFYKWDDLKQYITPVSDIIFIDNYIMSNESDINTNLIPFLKVLIGEQRNINLVLFVSRNANHYVDLPATKEKDTERIRAYLEKMKKILVRELEFGNKGKITIIMSANFHDRTVLTNYLRIYSGDSFNYFLPKENKKQVDETIVDRTKGDEIHLSSLADKDNRYLAETLIAKIQSYVDSLSPNAIIGDKESRFLTFKNIQANNNPLFNNTFSIAKKQQIKRKKKRKESKYKKTSTIL